MRVALDKEKIMDMMRLDYERWMKKDVNIVKIVEAIRSTDDFIISDGYRHPQKDLPDDWCGFDFMDELRNL